MNDALIAVFAKHWTPGAVKTRLAVDIGHERAAELYREFLATTLQRFASVADRRVVVYSPPEAGADFAALAGADWRLVPQCDGNLGMRMKSFFADALASGVRRVVIIGSDSPSLPVDFVTRAFDELQSSPVVLGPAVDGGYYLLGIADQLPPIFEGLPWSENRLLAATLERLRESNVPLATLPEWYDIDDLQSWQRYQRETA